MLVDKFGDVGDKHHSIIENFFSYERITNNEKLHVMFQREDKKEKRLRSDNTGV